MKAAIRGTNIQPENVTTYQNPFPDDPALGRALESSNDRTLLSNSSSLPAKSWNETARGVSSAWLPLVTIIGLSLNTFANDNEINGSDALKDEYHHVGSTCLVIMIRFI
jgi:hypothetical protein